MAPNQTRSQRRSALLLNGPRVPSGHFMDVIFHNKAQHDEFTSEDINSIVRECFEKLEKYAMVTFFFPKEPHGMLPDIIVAYRTVDGEKVAGCTELGVSLSAFKARISGRPTLELTLGRQASKASIKGVAWHEQLHALGYGHEHQRRDAPFEYKPVSSCARILGFSEEDIQTNLTNPEGDSDDEYTPDFDPYSNSGYKVSPVLTRNGKGNPGAPGCSPHAMVANLELSSWDTTSLQRSFRTTNHNHRHIGWSRVQSQPARHSLNAYRSLVKGGKNSRSAERTAHVHYRLKYLYEASLWEPEVSSELTYHF